MIHLNQKFLPKRIFIALSCGVDSIAASHFLNRTREVTCVHVNHGLRPQNNRMEEKAIAFCQHFNIPIIVKRAREHNPFWAKREDFFKKNGVEATARNIRLFEFRELNDLVLCHHLDDAIESYCFNFFQGKINQIPIRWHSIINYFEGHILNFWRPFLLTSKQDFIKYVERHGLKDFVEEDETNKDNFCRRNWVRNDLLPKLKQQNIHLKKVVRKFYL